MYKAFKINWKRYQKIEKVHMLKILSIDIVKIAIIPKVLIQCKPKEIQTQFLIDHEKTAITII